MARTKATARKRARPRPNPGFFYGFTRADKSRRIKLVDEDSEAPEILQALHAEGHGGQLSYVDKRHYDNEEIIRAATLSTPYAFEFASDRLTKDRALVLFAVSLRGDNLLAASKELRDDEEVVEAAMKQDKFALRYASPRLGRWSPARHHLFPPNHGRLRAMDLLYLGVQMEKQFGIFQELWIEYVMPLAMEPLGSWFLVRDEDLNCWPVTKYVKRQRVICPLVPETYFDDWESRGLDVECHDWHE